MSEGVSPGRVACPQCSGLNPEIARFCNRCGADLAKAPTGAAALPPPSDKQRKICPGCHRFNTATAAFCADCGVALPAHATVPLFGGPAGFWLRVVATVIDAVVLVVASELVSARLGMVAVDIEHLPLETAIVRSLPSFALDTTIYAIYAMIMVGTWGGTVGKLLLGLRVVRQTDGSKVPYGLALGRALAGFVSAIPIGLGYLWVALTPAKRAWHDYLCDTRVVRARAE